MRVIVADDDPAARARIRSLAASIGGLTIVAECGDGRETVSALREHEPVDALFLDVEMPVLDGFGVIREVGAEKMPPIVFVSGYSEFAVRAFEAYAVDYLLKPYEDARFADAVARLRTSPRSTRGSGAAQPGASGDARLMALTEEFHVPTRREYPEALAIRLGDRYVVVRWADVDWIEADGNHSRIHSQRRAHVITRTLVRLEQDLLDPKAFVRVHRSAIVNVRVVIAAEPLAHGDMLLILRDGQRVPCSRRYRERLERQLTFTT